MQSEFPGVYHRPENKSNPWVSYISDQETTIYMGAYKDELTAALAYLNALEDYWGKSAYLKISLEDVNMFKALKPTRDKGQKNYNAYTRMKKQKEQYSTEYKRNFVSACFHNDETKMNSLECLCHTLPDGAKCERCYFQELQEKFNPKGDDKSEYKIN